MKKPLQTEPEARRRRAGWLAVDLSTAIALSSITLPTLALGGLLLANGVAGTGALLGEGVDVFGEMGRTVLDAVTDREAWMRAVRAVGVRSGDAL